MTVDQVTDNGDNSLTIVGHDGDTTYTTSAGRKSDLPAREQDQMQYYVDILEASIPPEAEVLYQNPDYTPPEDDSDTIDQ